jgi:hypothetical protein
MDGISSSIARRFKLHGLADEEDVFVGLKPAIYARFTAHGYAL